LINVGAGLDSIVVEFDSSLTNLIGSGDMRDVVTPVLPQETQGFKLSLMEVCQDLNAVMKLLVHTQRLPKKSGVCQPEKSIKKGEEMIKVVTIMMLTIGLSGCLKEEIKNFVECEAAGYPVMESYPRQCRTKEGKLFVEEIETKQERSQDKKMRNCVEKCGDGICQEIVCMGLECPCSETSLSCPSDCGKE